jgi:hypothetical protein
MPSEFSRDSRPLPDGQVTAQPDSSCEHLPRVPNPLPVLLELSRSRAITPHASAVTRLVVTHRQAAALPVRTCGPTDFDPLDADCVRVRLF